MPTEAQEPWHWIYSSGRDYHIDKRRFLDIVFWDGFLRQHELMTWRHRTKRLINQVNYSIIENYDKSIAGSLYTYWCWFNLVWRVKKVFLS